MPTRFFLLLFFTSIVSGCCEQNDLALRPSTTVWLPYAPQQRLLFLNETGDSLTFIAAFTQYKQHATDKVCGDYAIETKEVNLKLKQDTAFQVQVTLSHEVIVSIQVLNKQTKTSNLFVQYNSISKQIITDAWRDRSEAEQNVNGNIYPQVLHLYGNQIPGMLSFSDLLYAPIEGLIGFKLFDGNWYYLHKQ